MRKAVSPFPAFRGVWRALCPLLLAMAACPGSTAQGETASSPEESGVEMYRILWQRNIFSPDRQPDRTHMPAAAPEPELPAERLKLVGTAFSDGKASAFFTGYRQASQTEVNVGQQLGDFVVEAADFGSVTLAQGEAHYTVPVGGAFDLLSDPMTHGFWRSRWTLESRPPHCLQPRLCPSGTVNRSLERSLERG